MKKKISLPFSDIIIIESLAEGDRSTGKELEQDINSYIGTLPKAPRITFSQVYTKRDFVDGLHSLCDSCKKTGMIPILHLEIHGCEKGLGLSSEDLVTWQELRDLLEPINTACRDKLLVTLAVCCGSYFMQTLLVNRHAPFWGIVGSFEPLKVNNLLACYKQFYKSYLKTLNLNTAVDALQKANMQTTAKYSLITSVETFVNVYSHYIKTQMTPEALRRRAHDTITSGSSAKSADERAAMEQEFIEKVLSRRDNEYQQARNTFFALDKNPQSEEAKEIPSSYDEFAAKYCTPKISVIVPVYNVEQYLRRCVDSILAQTFTDFELLLIDDGSKDSSGKICDKYAAKDERVRVFHKENGGVSSARNLGLDNARGEWISFVDADDFLMKNALEIYTGLNASISDLLMAGFRALDEKNTVREQPKIMRLCELSVVEALKEMYSPSDFSYQGYLWCKLFRNGVIQQYHLRFVEDISFNEDRLFIVEYLCRCKRHITYTTDVVYNYIHRNNSAMSSLRKGYNKKFATDFDAFVLMYKRISEYTKDKELIHLALNGICDSYKTNHNMMRQFNQYDRDIHRHMLKELIRTKALLQYVKSILKPFFGYLGLLLFPKITIKLSNK